MTLDVWNSTLENSIAILSWDIFTSSYRHVTVTINAETSKDYNDESMSKRKFKIFENLGKIFLP